MPEAKTLTTSDLVPTFQYRDARTAIGWLQEAFGFEPTLVLDEDDGTLHHAQMRAGNGIIMISPARDDVLRMGSAGDAPGGAISVYVIVEDADAHYERAQAAGAEIVLPLEDKNYGGRGYTVRDIEGNMWSFGTYRPEA